MSKIFHLFQMYVVFECFIFQVQTAGVGVHEGKQGQAAVIDTWRRCKPLLVVWGGGTGRAVLCARGGGESSRWRGRDGRRAGVEEAEASHPSSVGSGSEAGGSDASAGNGAGASSAQIRADRAEQPPVSR
jgi:hypothetical protein